jgi:DNA-binding transcriptional regulator YiaG
MQKANRYRVTRIGKRGQRDISYMTNEELKRFRALRLKEIRTGELKLTQKDLANAVGVNLRTLQDWELGRNSMPKPVEILMELMRETPSIKRRLVAQA